MASNPAVHVTGIRELGRALSAVDKELAREFRKELRSIAKQVVATAVGKGAPAGILKPSSTTRGAAIRFPKGGPESATERYGFYPWLDFGGGKATGRGVTPSGSRRAVLKEGRYLYPAISDEMHNIERDLGNLVERIAERQRFEVRGR